MRAGLFTVPNLLSLSRIPLAVAASALILADGLDWWAGACVIAAISTDFLDGFVARRTGSVSEAGKILDPVADKIAFLIFLFALVDLGRVPSWVLLTVAVRELAVLAGGLIVWLSGAGRRRGAAGIPASNIWGKLSTCALSAYLLKQAFWPAPPLLLGLDWAGLVAMFFLLLSTLVYSSRLIGSGTLLRSTADKGRG